jgi:glycyl-tRNA synthetase beta chain
MSADFLVELGTEELPPKALLALSNAFTSGIVDGFKAANLSFVEVISYAAPRRLAVVIKGLDVQAPDSEIVVWGPPAKVAFDAEGQPTRAAEAFAKKNAIDIAQLNEYIDNDGQQDKLCARRTEAGCQTSSLLGPVINQSLAALPIPKRMRWGSSKEEFVRPVQWAVLLFNGSVFHEDVMGLTSGNISRGHRFHSEGDIVITSPDSYAEQLREAYVIADFNQRRDIIREGVTELAATIDGQAVIDEDLLDEVSALNEWPVPLMGRFDEHFLQVPSQALISSMKEHQKYFHVVDQNNNLMAAFVTVANIESKDPGQVIDGNERVIRPRLADAAFFYQNDMQSSLESRRELLKQVVFQAKLGSVFAKTERVAALAETIAQYTGTDPKLARRAAELSKSDLVTDMVGEFDDLQGTMGRDYALNDGEPKEVAEALFEQYLPRFAGDQVPDTGTGTTLALADRLDSLVGIFSIGQQPSGSRDPFALRRASLGVLRIMIERRIDLDLTQAINAAAAQFELKKEGELSSENISKQVLTYIIDRFKSWYKDEGMAAEIFMAVAALELSNPLDINARVQAVNQFSQLPEAVALAAANKRVANILAKQLGDTAPGAVQSALLQEPAEQALASAIELLSEEIEPLVQQRDYSGILQKLAQLREPVDGFFDQVMVMADDQAIRNNRLALLFSLRQLFINVADISQLIPSK